MKQKIYLSGPMTGYPDYNRPAFLKAEAELQAVLDASFINPARLDSQAKPEWQWPDFMRNSLKGMMDACTIYMLNGWENSKGAKIELALAKELGMPVMYQPMPALDYGQMLKDGLIILDTETTGLGDDDEIVEIAIINQDGDVLIDTLVKPSRPVPDDVVKIHGISNAMLEDAPGWGVVAPLIAREVIPTCPHIVIWNKEFDIRLIEQTDRIHLPEVATLLGPFFLTTHNSTHCAQIDYMQRYGQRKPDGTLKRQSLAAACEQLDIMYDWGLAHRALYDCQLTLKVIKALAAKDQERML